MRSYVPDHRTWHIWQCESDLIGKRFKFKVLQVDGVLKERYCVCYFHGTDNGFAKILIDVEPNRSRF